MKTEKWILNKIDENIKDIIKLATIRIRMGDVRFSGMSGLRTSHAWTAIRAYCDVLEINHIKYWNQICKICPNLGDVTEE